MIRQWKQITGLSVALVALAGLATWDEWQTKQDEKAKEIKGLITSLKSENIVGILFRSIPDGDAGGKSEAKEQSASVPVEVSLKNVDGRWQINSPVQTAADQQTVADLLKNVTEYKTESEIASGKDKWEAYGLVKPRRTLELETADGKKTSFYVGFNTPVGFKVYVATSASDAIFTGSQYIATSTAKTLFDLREKRILNTSAPSITSLKMTSPSETITLERSSGGWLLKSPVVASADAPAVNNLVDDIVGLKASEFFDQPDKKLKDSLFSKKPLLNVELVTDKSSIFLQIREGQQSTYATITGGTAIFKVADELRTKIVKSSKSLRDKKIFTFQSADINKVSIDGQFFKRVSTDWYAEKDASKFGTDGKYTGKPEEQPKGASHVRGLLVDLEYARAEDILEANDSIVKKLPKAPKHQIVVEKDGKNSKLTVDIWLAQDNPESIYIRQSDSNQTYRAKRSVIASVTPSAIVPVGDEANTPTLSN